MLSITLFDRLNDNVLRAITKWIDTITAKMFHWPLWRRAGRGLLTPAPFWPPFCQECQNHRLLYCANHDFNDNTEPNLRPKQMRLNLNSLHLIFVCVSMALNGLPNYGSSWFCNDLSEAYSSITKGIKRSQLRTMQTSMNRLLRTRFVRKRETLPKLLDQINAKMFTRLRSWEESVALLTC